MIVHADVETRSPVKLKQQGAFVYFEHPKTEVLMCAYRIDDGSIAIWERGQDCPPDLAAAILADATIVAHNAQFEMLAFEWLHKHRGWPRVKFHQFRDTAAQAAALALPRALEDLGDALGLATKKDKEGKRLIDKFSKPRRSGGWNEPQDHPEDWEKFKAYCKQDVVVEEAAEARMVPLPNDEHDFWFLSELINRRGIRIDRRSAIAAIKLAEKAKGAFDAELAEITGGAVKHCSEAAAMARWADSRGVDLPSVDKPALLEALAGDLPQDVRRAFELRQAAAKTSVAKLKTMLARASCDGRVRGAFIYHAASTGRTQSVGVNFNNLPRPRQAFLEAKIRPDLLFDAIRQSEPALLPLLYGDEVGNPMHLLADAIRGFVWAAPGREFVVADFSGIEGAVIAWLAGEAWKLGEMHRINADPMRPDLYRLTASQITGLSTDIITKKHPLRQSVGKVSELALGFGGGVSAFASMAKNYNVDLEALFAPIADLAPAWMIDRANSHWQLSLRLEQPSALTLSRKAWLASDLIKLGWRHNNKAIVQLWADLEDASRIAVLQPGTILDAGRCRFRTACGFLFCQLPSGRCLAYPAPRLKAQVWAQRKRDDGKWSPSMAMDHDIAAKGMQQGTVRVENKTLPPKVTALGVNSVTRKWERFPLYGGHLAENCTQAVARDLLKNGMRKAEEAGYPIVLTVYDEIVAEVQRGFGDLASFERLICELPVWAHGLPLTADGYRAKRYRKG